MIRNLTRDTVLARQPRVATAPWTRMRGMLWRRFEDFDAMVFPHCQAIHMAFMRMALDIVFLDDAGRVTSVRPGLRPWRIASDSEARVTVELPVGTISASGTAAGDQLDGPGIGG